MNICKEEGCVYNQNGKCTNIQEPIGTALNKAIKYLKEFESKNKISVEDNDNA